MPPRRRTDPAAGRAAALAAAADLAAGRTPERSRLATAVRWSLEELSTRHPGNHVEVRVPPFGAVQVLPGPRHTRGTPPAVVETDGVTWLQVVVGERGFGAALDEGRIRASGLRADLSDLLPLLRTGEPSGDVPSSP
ncbi:sterol carrier family protein [Kineococcus gynurae]|uniref:Sterol carrier family protein n=1 Tax=Kineococcus gynurae TaxID=452979 RepID=A0ABV5LRT5_9ACTN